MHNNDKINVRETKIVAMPDTGHGELSDRVLRQCDFCGKEVEVTPLNRVNLETLSGRDAFYCPFCLGNGFHGKSNRNVLILSFRSIFGYFYYEHYLAGHAHPRKRMSYSQIEDFIAAHRLAGVGNPVFRYDDDTFCWFVDFNRVGNSKRRLKLAEVQKTVINILACFDLWEHVINFQMAAFYAKYNEAIVDFYERRYRPERRMLAPTFSGCGDNGKNMLADKIRCFTRKQLLLK